MFKKILIANRGEIAVRILRTCREMGVKTVAVYSEVDRKSLHVRFSNEAYLLGGPAPEDSYLRMDKILEIAKKSGAEAIHPGFGFLAENAEFVRRVEAAGLVFIGPSAKSMEIMGDKIRSRRAMMSADVPVVPGMLEPLDDASQACAAAANIGYPVMLKASAGGGGKGIRIVRAEAEMESAYLTASGEAENAFGDGRMYIEKFLDRPRHIEIQILADQQGRVMHLGERECSIQRRHQKLIEEAPAVGIDKEMREKMGAAAVAAAAAVDYRSAGTVEFLFSDGQFYFLEMNTRLQVEHAITEEVYGVDLVEQMLLIAAGEPLTLADGMQPRGHAIEVRLNAEDPENQFMPSIGTVGNIRLPGGPGVRVDSAIYRSMEITPFYDSMLAKLIVHGSNRQQALRRMVRVLQELHVGGILTSAGVALEVIQSQPFQDGEYDTGYLERFREDEKAKSDFGDLEEVAALVAVMHRMHTANSKRIQSHSDGPGLSAWLQESRRQQMRGGR